MSDTQKKTKKDIKVAEEIFKGLGVEKDKLCEHGLKFFQCMPCSH